MKNLLVILTLTFTTLSLAGPGDGTLPPLRTLGVVIDNGTSRECKSFDLQTKGLKSLDKKLEFKSMEQSLRLLPGKNGINLEVSTPKSPVEKLQDVLENNDEVITILLPEQKVKEVLLFTNSEEALAEFLLNNGC